MRMPIFALAATLLFSAAGSAHEVKQGPNGGRVVDAGAYHVELVRTGTTIELFITDATDRPAAAGLKGTAIILVNGKQQRIVLESAAPGRLRGTVDAPPSASMKAVVQLTTADGTPLTARFQ